MSLFERFLKEKDDFDPDENWEQEESEDEIEEDIKTYWGTIDKGDCIFCHAKDAMKNYDEVCFVCNKCKQSIDYKGYLIWASGHQITFEDFR